MKRERTGTPIQVGTLTVTPVAEIRLEVARWRRGVYVWGSLDPVAVLIRRDDHVERIDLRNAGEQVARSERRGHE